MDIRHSHLHWYLRGALFFGVLLLGVGCTSADAENGPDQDQLVMGDRSPSMTTRPSVDPDPLAEEILSDGSVTDAEMERALLAVVECVRAAGFNAELVDFRPRIGWSLQVSSPDLDMVELADDQQDLCSARFVDSISDPYFAEHGLSEAERTARNGILLSCLVEKDNDLAGMTVEQVLGLPNLTDYPECERIADNSAGR